MRLAERIRRGLACRCRQREGMKQRDFLHVDHRLVPGGFILFDDRDEFGAFPQVHAVVQEAIRGHGYELAGANPHHLVRKPVSPAGAC